MTSLIETLASVGIAQAHPKYGYNSSSLQILPVATLPQGQLHDACYSLDF